MSAQECACRAEDVSVPNFSVYVEAGGFTGLMSLHFERKLNENFRLHVARGWWQTFSLSDDNSYSRSELPLMVHYLKRANGRSPDWLELGAGFIEGRAWQFGTHQRQTHGALIANVGYRRMSRRMLFRIGVSGAHVTHGNIPGGNDRPRFSSGLGVGF
jgi:hypothetical protein